MQREIKDLVDVRHCKIGVIEQQHNEVMQLFPWACSAAGVTCRLIGIYRS